MEVCCIGREGEAAKDYDRDLHGSLWDLGSQSTSPMPASPILCILALLTVCITVNQHGNPLCHPIATLDAFSGCVTIANILGCFKSRDWAALVSWHAWVGEMGAGPAGGSGAGGAEHISVVCWWLFI